ncbi:MAG: DUF308 domain-containing protein [Acidimicrobiales bacterium]
MMIGRSNDDAAAAIGGPGPLLSMTLAVGAIIAGVVLLAWPAPTVLVFSQLAGWSMGAIGALGAVEEASKGRARSSSFAVAAGIGALGVILALWPGRTILVATILAGGWLIAAGGSRVLATVGAERPRDEVVGNLLGALEVLLGALVALRPVAGARAVAVFAGLGLVVHGVARLWEAFRSRP